MEQTNTNTLSNHPPLPQLTGAQSPHEPELLAKKYKAKARAGFVNAAIQAIILAVFKWQTRGLNAPLGPIWFCVAFGIIGFIGGFVYLQKSRKLEAS